MLQIVEYEDSDGGRPFFKWFGRLNTAAALKIRTALARIEAGNLSSLKAIGRGVSEIRVDFGPGYRIYLGRDGERLVVLLGGGTKKRQQRDIEQAIECWRDYKARKPREGR